MDVSQADSTTRQFQVRVRNVSAPGAERFSSGQVLEFLIEDELPESEFRILLQHDELLNLTPSREWSHHRSLLWLTSAPGIYRLIFERRIGDEVSAFAVCEVEVLSEGPLDPGPMKVMVGQDVVLWVPSRWERGYLESNYEAPFREALMRWSPLGGVVFDLGANLGFHAIPLALKVGASGRLYCFEANPYCVLLLRANLRANLVRNATILPVAVGNEVGTVPFLIDFGNSAIGTLAESPLFHYKTGQEIRVECHRLDELMKRALVRPPDLVKVDIEGSELPALQGMEELLRARHPTLVMEIHGAEIGQALFEFLDGLGYRHQLLPDTSTWYSGAEILAKPLENIFQIVSVNPAAENVTSR